MTCTSLLPDASCFRIVSPKYIYRGSQLICDLFNPHMFPCFKASIRLVPFKQRTLRPIITPWSEFVLLPSLEPVETWDRTLPSRLKELGTCYVPCLNKPLRQEVPGRLLFKWKTPRCQPIPSEDGSWLLLPIKRLSFVLYGSSSVCISAQVSAPFLGNYCRRDWRIVDAYGVHFPSKSSLLITSCRCDYPLFLNGIQAPLWLQTPARLPCIPLVLCI
jgi:hypothetical protein